MEARGRGLEGARRGDRAASSCRRTTSWRASRGWPTSRGCTYLLGYEPTNAKRDGRYRKLKVEVLRPGLSVRARSGYFAAKGKEKPAPQPSVVERVLRNPFDADGIPLRLAAYVMGEAPAAEPGAEDRASRSWSRARCASTRSQTRVKDGRLVAEPKLDARRRARASGESHESKWTLEIALEPPAGAESAKAVAPVPDPDRDVPRRPPGPAGGGERRACRIGDGDFVVPDFTEERLSTPILSDQLLSPAAPGRAEARRGA